MAKHKKWHYKTIYSSQSYNELQNYEQFHTHSHKYDSLIWYLISILLWSNEIAVYYYEFIVGWIIGVLCNYVDISTELYINYKLLINI